MTITEYLEDLNLNEETDVSAFEVHVIIDDYTVWTLSWEQLKDLVNNFRNHNIVIRSIS